MNCDGSGWIGVGVGNATHAQRCGGCGNCMKTTAEPTSGLQCPRCLQWFPGPGIHHVVEGKHVVPHVLEAPNESNTDSAN